MIVTHEVPEDFTQQVTTCNPPLLFSWNASQIQEHLNQNHSYNLFCLSEEGLVGFLLSSLLPIGNECEAELFHIEVFPNHQRGGVATRLIESLHQKCQNSFKKSVIYLETAKTNHFAINFYEKMGYKTYNERKNYYGSTTIAPHSNTALLFSITLDGQ